VARATSDAYGEELLAHYKGQTGSEIVEREDWFIQASRFTLARYFATFGDWPAHERKAIAFAKGRVLDIGCGAGRHSLYLQGEGLDVTGIDSSPGAVRVCRLRGLKKVGLRPIEEIGKFHPDSFDTVIMLGNNFGLFGGPKKAKSLLKKLHRITSRDALIIAESTDPYETKEPAHREYQKSNRAKGRMPGQIRIRVRLGRTIGPWFNYLLVSRKEMESVLKDTGWAVERTFKAEGAPQYIAIIRKTSASVRGL
jgi:SAM-dependent methyltransferase